MKHVVFTIASGGYKFLVVGVYKKNWFRRNQKFEIKYILRTFFNPSVGMYPLYPPPVDPHITIAS